MSGSEPAQTARRIPQIVLAGPTVVDAIASVAKVMTIAAGLAAADAIVDRTAGSFTAPPKTLPSLRNVAVTNTPGLEGASVQPRTGEKT